MSYFIAVISAFCLLRTTLSHQPDSPGVVVYFNHSEGYHTFRIPTLGVIGGGGGGGGGGGSGTLLAFAEGRARLNFSTGDTADCYGEGASAFDWKCTNKDVVLKRSFDGGRTWGPLQVLAFATDTYFFSNPQPLVTASGAAFVQYSQCDSTHIPPNGDAFTNCSAVVRKSDDAGATWGEPLPSPLDRFQNAGGFGGVQLASGRLIFSLAGDTGCLYSDNGGVNWVYGVPPQHIAENQIAELTPNVLLMTSRGHNNSRELVRSHDGGLSWDAPQVQAVTDPNCQASMIAVRTADAAAAFLLFANPHTSGLLPYAEGRQNVTVQISYDAGSSWAPTVLIDQGPSAYTALAQLDLVECAILYEESADLPVDFRSIRFVAFPCAGPPPDPATIP
jgi:sialidase-1